MTVRTISLSFILWIWLASCAGKTEPLEEIRFGFIAPLGQSHPPSQGAFLAADEINAAGGLRLGDQRFRLRILAEDNEGRPEMAVSKALKLISRENVTAIIGVPMSTNAIPVSAIAERHQIPLIITMATYPDITRDKPHVFRLACLNSDQAQALANFAFDDLNARQAAALVNAARTYSTHLARVFTEKFEERGGKMVAHETFTDEDTDFTDTFERIRSSKPDLLFLPNHPDFAIPHMRQAREMGIEARFLGGDSWNLFTASDLPVPSAYFLDIWAPDAPNPTTTSFLRRFQTAFGTRPTTSAALSFDAVHLLAEAIQVSASSHPDTLRQAIAAFNPFTGVTGDIRFENHGDPTRTLFIRRFEPDGTMVLHKPIQPEVLP